MISITDFQKKKNQNEKISMLTCYDFWSAQILNNTSVDCLLVGDSLAMVMHGAKDTLRADVKLMSLHIQAVSKGAPNKFIVGDMPFLAHRKGIHSGMKSVETLMRAGSHAVKIEGTHGHLDFIKYVVESGVPVMGHIGLTPQSIHQLGGFKVQGKESEAAKDILNQAKQLEDAGCFAVVLECVPKALAETVTQEIKIPTIGIGAGNKTDGQVLVLQDMLGMNLGFKPKFLKTYLNGAELINQSIEQFIKETNDLSFPSEKESY